jgi:hypothetical protein
LRHLQLYSNQLSGSVPLTFANFANLDSFWFHNTNLCEPDVEAFKSWLAGVSNVISTNVLCSPAAILALEPPTVTIGVGETFELPIVVEAGSQEVDGASAYLNFEPTYLEVVSTTLGSRLPIEIENSFDNQSGQVNISMGGFSDFPTDTFNLAIVTFRALSVTNGTPVDFNLSDLRQSDVAFAGHSLLESTEKSTVIIQNAILLCSVTLQGRPTPPDERFRVPLMVSLTVAGESQPTYQFTPTTDENGTFSVAGIIPGTYELRVKKSSTLQNKQTITLVGGSNDVDCGTLREGDANNNNVINILDFSILAGTFGKCEGDNGYDERADEGGDGCVNILDFSLLASNFGQAGDMAAETRTSQASRQVAMLIQPAQASIKSGEAFNVTVQLDAGEQQVDGAQIMLNFDPTILAVEEVMAFTGKREPLPLQLLNQFDNQSGTIHFAAGALEAFPSGEYELVELRFRALEAGETQLEFELDGAMGSDVTFGGTSILSSHTNGTIIIEQVPTAVTLDKLSATTLASWQWLIASILITLTSIWFARRQRRAP